MLSIEKQHPIPTIGYGTWNLSGHVEEIIQNAVLAGYRYFDCTAAYGNEKRLGTVFKYILSHPGKFKVKRDDVLLLRCHQIYGYVL
jgi:diketogulonate reductase-like aldo/keto reductase